MLKSKVPPPWAVEAVTLVRRGMARLQRRMTPPEATLMEIVGGMWLPYAIWLVAELGIADLLKDGPRDVASLARATGTNQDALFRVLRPLAHDGILARTGERTFALTSLSQPLRSDHPTSVRQTVRQVLSSWNLRTWSDLLEVVRTGRPAFPRLHGGRDLWTWFADEAPETGRVFHDSMEEITRMAVPSLLAAHDFGRYRRILDVGGGHGTLLAGILRAHPGVQGGILDVAEALKGAPEALERAGVHNRVELIEGSIFDEIPRGWDAYVMKNILHGVDHDGLRSILSKVREALTGSARLLVVEAVVPDQDSGVYPAFIDLQMLIGSGGRERTATQYRDLFAEHGLRLDQIVRTTSPSSLLIITRA